MKKLLMIGTVLVSLSSMMTSCSHEDLYDPNFAVKQAEAQYEQVFVSRFGQPASDQDWGFETVGIDASTRSSDSNANEWGDIGVPKPVSEEERKAAVEWFSTHKDWDEETINLTDFFVQQVWKGGNVYTAADGQNTCVGSDKMDYLFCSASPISGTVDMNAVDHVFNFNHGTGSVNHEVWEGTMKGDDKVFSSDTIMLMRNTSSLYWAYNNTEDSQFHPKYKVKKIGNSYYIGFDFEATGSNPNQQYEADGYYSDWIIRIVGLGSTGKPQSARHCRRSDGIREFRL